MKPTRKRVPGDPVTHRGVTDAAKRRHRLTAAKRLNKGADGVDRLLGRRHGATLSKPLGYVKRFDAWIDGPSDLYSYMGMGDRWHDSVANIAARLALARAALAPGKTQIAFAEDAGLKSTAYGNHETGAGRIGLDSAIALCARYGLSLDWIYFGDRAGLPNSVAERLMSHAMPNIKPPSRRGRTRPFQKAS